MKRRAKNPVEVDARPSRSQRKREVEALQVLGEQLSTLSEQSLKALPLDERLLDALQAAKQVNQRGAHKRQLQYIGKLMRQIDDDVLDAIVERLQQDSRFVLPVLPTKGDEAEV
jgi:ribosome-associated protein